MGKDPTAVSAELQRAYARLRAASQNVNALREEESELEQKLVVAEQQRALPATETPSSLSAGIGDINAEEAARAMESGLGIALRRECEALGLPLGATDAELAVRLHGALQTRVSLVLMEKDSARPTVFICNADFTYGEIFREGCRFFMLHAEAYCLTSPSLTLLPSAQAVGRRRAVVRLLIAPKAELGSLGPLQLEALRARSEDAAPPLQPRPGGFALDNSARLIAGFPRLARYCQPVRQLFASDFLTAQRLNTSRKLFLLLGLCAFILALCQNCQRSLPPPAFLREFDALLPTMRLSSPAEIAAATSKLGRLLVERQPTGGYFLYRPLCVQSTPASFLNLPFPELYTVAAVGDGLAELCLFDGAPVGLGDQFWPLLFAHFSEQLTVQFGLNFVLSFPDLNRLFIVDRQFSRTRRAVFQLTRGTASLLTNDALHGYSFVLTVLFAVVGLLLTAMFLLSIALRLTLSPKKREEIKELASAETLCLLLFSVSAVLLVTAFVLALARGRPAPAAAFSRFLTFQSDSALLGFLWPISASLLGCFIIVTYLSVICKKYVFVFFGLALRDIAAALPLLAVIGVGAHAAASNLLWLAGLLLMAMCLISAYADVIAQVGFYDPISVNFKPYHYISQIAVLNFLLKTPPALERKKDKAAGAAEASLEGVELTPQA